MENFVKRMEMVITMPQVQVILFVAAGFWLQVILFGAAGSIATEFDDISKRLISNNALSDNPALKGSEYGASQGLKDGIYGTEKGYEANRKEFEYSVSHPNETVAAIASTVVAGAESQLKKRQGVLLLPCVKDETSNQETGFCDSLIPVAEERDIVQLIQRSIFFNAHRRFARPQVSHM